MAETESTPAQKHPKRKKLLVVGSIVLLVLVAGAAGVALRWWQTKDDVENIPTPTLTEDATTLQNLSSEGNEEEFNKRAAEILANPNLDSKTRYQVLLQQGSNFANKQEWQEAIAAYSAAEDIQETYEVVQLLAETYKQSGDNAKAIEYYKKAVDLVPEDSPVAEAEKAWLEDSIRALEEGQGQ